MHIAVATQFWPSGHLGQRSRRSNLRPRFLQQLRQTTVITRHNRAPLPPGFEAPDEPYSASQPDATLPSVAQSTHVRHSAAPDALGNAPPAAHVPVPFTSLQTQLAIKGRVMLKGCQG